MTIKIASWNVNSIRSRLDIVIKWAKQVNPDILLLQELKTEQEKFPYSEIEELGYNIAINGQKSYNGVAILSKYPLDDIINQIPLYKDHNLSNYYLENYDKESRYIEATTNINGKLVRIASIYVPNGANNEEIRYPFKLNFLSHLENHAKNILRFDELIILGGDYNVAPYDIDVFDPKNLENQICFREDEKKALRKIINLGYQDIFRIKNKNQQQFSWWDYRGSSFDYNKGMRIDHLLLSPLATDNVSECYIDEEPRKWDKPSDHAPIIVSFNN